MNEIQQFSLYQVEALRVLYRDFDISQIGTVKDTGALIVQYIHNGTMKTKLINQTP